MKATKGDPGVRVTMVTAVLAILFFLALGFWPIDRPCRPVPPERPAGEFARNRADLEWQLGPYQELLESLHFAAPERQREIMDFAVQFLKERVLVQMREEERTVYPEAERGVRATLHETVCIRHWHFVIEQWVEELGAIAYGCCPDAEEFKGKAEGLVAFLREHFEFEDRVIFPGVKRDMGAGMLCEP